MKKSLYIAFAALALQACTTAQPLVSGNNSDQIFNKAYESITTRELQELLTVVASDEMEGRDTGSEGQKKAGRYIISQYKNAGIGFPAALKGYYQHIPSQALRGYDRELPPSENILAYIKGSEKPDELIVLSAHYDHVGKNAAGEVFNGADDDGSGTVALIELAEAFQLAKKAGKGPKRSVLFLHVTGEEHGLLGSEYYSNHPVFPLQNTVANLNIDMIGRSDAANLGKNYVYVIGSAMLSSELKKITETANRDTHNLELNYMYDDPADPQKLYYRSDHYNFAKHNIPIAFFFDGIHEDYHKTTDDADKIDYELLKKRTQLIFKTAWELANRDARIVVDGKNTR